MSKNVLSPIDNSTHKAAFSDLIAPERYRNLAQDEIKELIQNNNYAHNWDNIYVTNAFKSILISNCQFYGVIYIDDMQDAILKSANVELPVGLNGCMINSAMIGKNVAMKNVHYVKNYVIGDNSLLLNINQLSCSENAVFGNGYIYNKADDRSWLEISNENGGRKILPFAGIIAADAFLWSRFRERHALDTALIKFTDNLLNANHIYGEIGENCCIKNTSEISDGKIGSFCRIDGANKLSNITVFSNENEAGFIGEDVDIQNAIIGHANKIFMGPKCENIVTGRNVKIELGARVLNTFVADNSTIACCEVLNNLVFPFHEQHHNNSFLIATTILGQSNIAAGATIGSNHNSRAADGEILAGRGFWPGLESNYKHNSFFASFTLIAKGTYETELNIELPFALVSKDADSGIVQVFPGFWFKYNMYALARNSWKFANRDKRKVKTQNIEMDYLAPDSALEMLNGIKILEDAISSKNGKIPVVDEINFDPKTDLTGIFLENATPKTKVLIIKPLQGIWLYKIMLSYFAARELAQLIADKKQLHRSQLKPFSDSWMNFGGQLIADSESSAMISDIENGKIKSWDQVHDRYNKLWEKYPEQKTACALHCWLKMNNKTVDEITSDILQTLFTNAVKTSEKLVKWTTESREKDYTNPFRKITYRNDREMDAVIGKLEDNSFIDEMANQHKEFSNLVDSVMKVLKDFK